MSGWNWRHQLAQPVSAAVGNQVRGYAHADEDGAHLGSEVAIVERGCHNCGGAFYVVRNGLGERLAQYPDSQPRFIRALGDRGAGGRLSEPWARYPVYVFGVGNQVGEPVLAVLLRLDYGERLEVGKRADWRASQLSTPESGPARGVHRGREKSEAFGFTRRMIHGLALSFTIARPIS